MSLESWMFFGDFYDKRHKCSYNQGGIRSNSKYDAKVQNRINVPSLISHVDIYLFRC